MAASSDNVFALNRMNSASRKHGLGNLVNHQIYTSAASAGGAATEAMTLTGLAAADTILSVSQKTKGANGTAIIAWSSQAANSLTIEWTANPGAGAVVVVHVLKAAITS